MNSKSGGGFRFQYVLIVLLDRTEPLVIFLFCNVMYDLHTSKKSSMRLSQLAVGHSAQALVQCPNPSLEQKYPSAQYSQVAAAY